MKQTRLTLFALAFIAAILLSVGLTVFPPTAHAAPHAPTDDFVITVKTDNTGPSSDTQFTIPTFDGGGYNYNVDCNNDGTDEVTGATGDYTCDYGEAGTYTVRIKDNNGDGTGFPRIYFNSDGDRLKLLTIEQWGTGRWTSMARAFYGCANLAGQATDAPNLSNVTDMSVMFQNATAFNQNISGWDTTNVTDMNAMFLEASTFNQNIGGWNTANVTNMRVMFMRASAFNQNISGWNTANVTNMNAMFVSATAFNQNISSWDTTNVTNMSFMFQNATAFNQNIGGWNVSALSNATSMFAGVTLSTPNYDALLSGWNSQILQNDVTFDGGHSQYCAGAAARANMIASDGWTITDGGANTSCPLAVATSGTGSGDIVSDPSGLDCGLNCEASFLVGTVVTLTATADLGSIFTGWSGDLITTTNPLPVTINSTQTITATFALAPAPSYTIYLPLVVR